MLNKILQLITFFAVLLLPLGQVITLATQLLLSDQIGIVATLLLPFGQVATAEPRQELGIERERSPDGSVNYVYARNLSTTRSIRATITITEYTPSGGSRSLPDQVLRLAPGQRIFIGSDRSFDATYTFAVARAAYE